MSETRVTPLDMQRPIAHVALNGRRFDVYPSQDFVRAFNALLTRTGGAALDLIAQVSQVAQEALSTAQSAPAAAVLAYDAGAPPGYTLAPSAPTSVAALTQQTASASVAAHTRTPTGMPAIALDAGSVVIQRGVATIVYYVDPTDAGGAVTYLGTTDASVAGDYAAGARIVGSAYLDQPGGPYGGGGGGQPN